MRCGQPEVAGPVRPGCNARNTLVETVAEKASGHRFESLAPTTRLAKLSDIDAREATRIPTGIAEFDRALGGGLVAGGVVLIGGDPGIGEVRCCCRHWPIWRRRTRCCTSAVRNPANRWHARAPARAGHRQSAAAGGNQSRAHPGDAAGRTATSRGHRLDPDAVVRPSCRGAPGSVAQVRECAAGDHLAKQGTTFSRAMQPAVSCWPELVLLCVSAAVGNRILPLEVASTGNPLH